MNKSASQSPDKNGEAPTHNAELIESYLRHSCLKGLSDNSTNSYRYDLNHLANWTDRSGLSLDKLERQHLLSYLGARYDSGYHPRSTARLLSCLRGFFNYLLDQNTIQEDPMLHLSSPKTNQPLPDSLTETEVEALLEAPDTKTPIGLRNRVMLEILYGCGLRVSELVGLDIGHINTRQGVIRVFGKGRKERLVPMGEEAQFWLEKFLNESRPDLVRASHKNVLFPSAREGRHMSRQNFWHSVKKLAVQANIRRPLSPHTLRHAFASHLLNHGANLREVQLLLGHSNLSTTQIYTHIAQQRLNDLHAAHHPRG